MKIFFYPIFTIMVIICSGCSNVFSMQKQEEQAEIFWEQTVMPNYSRHLSSILHVHRTFGNDTSSNSTCHFDLIQTPSWIAYMNTEYGIYCKNDCKQITVINSTTQELSVFNPGGDAGWNAFQMYLLNEYLMPLINPSSRHAQWFQIENLYDSVIDGDSYKIIQAVDKSKYAFNPVSGEYDAPSYFKIYYCFNPTTKQVERVECKPIYNGIAVKYLINLDSCDDVDTLIRNIFNTDSPNYAGYSRHNDSFPPFSWCWNTSDSNILSSELLSYPIHKLNGDVTTIQMQEGWLLLDFWMFHCPACRTQIMKWENERKNGGKTVLECEGIHILSINATSDNTILLLHEDSICCSGQCRLCHAKGIGRYIYLQSMPQYYLISPDKKIIYRTTSLGDYSAILKAKQEYQHKK